MLMAIIIIGGSALLGFTSSAIIQLLIRREYRLARKDAERDAWTWHP